MRRTLLLATLLCPGLAAQTLFIGILGGAASTDAFQDLTLIPPQPHSVLSRRAFSPGKDFLAGASLEVQFNRHFSLEVDGIFRQLRLKQIILKTDAPDDIGKIPVVTWEFPVLAKYRLPLGRATPFVEAGPIFRTIGNLNATSPSQWGATAGAGFDVRWRAIRISPTVRYVRWRRDDPRSFPTLSVPDQLELLLGFSSDPASPWKPLGPRASVGVILGTNLTADVASSSITRSFLTPSSTISIFEEPGPRRLIVGPSFELDLPRNFAVEVDALYRKVTRRVRYRITGPVPPFAPLPREVVDISRTWEFPVFVKYRFRWRETRPYLGAGPSFRRPQALSTPSPYGAVIAAGIDARFRRLGISPSVRFTRWGQDRSPFSDVRRNQSELLVRFSF